jgi:hypothetical protein
MNALPYVIDSSYGDNAGALTAKITPVSEIDG